MVVEGPHLGEQQMVEITTIGLDLAKNIFQIHCIDVTGQVVRRQLRRSEVIKFFAALSPCLVGMEACATASSLGQRDREAGALCQADARGLRKAVCEAWED